MEETQTPISVTFDSNVWESIVDQGKLDSHAQSDSLGAIRGAIEQGQIAPYLSDVIVTLEAVKKAERAEFFREITVQHRRRDIETHTGEDGTPVLSRDITINASFDHRPPQHQKLSDALEAATNLGFRFISMPRIGWMRVEDELYKPNEATEEAIASRLERTFEAHGEFQGRGWGDAWAIQLGQEAMQLDPSLAARGVIPIQAFAHSSTPNKVPSAVAEWADGDALAAHYGHEHDVFCTLDEGGNAGENSVLHQSHRRFLLERFGIRVLTPADLAALL